MALRKFECWHCHRPFEADERQWVECPYCHSDNVDYACFHLPQGTWKWGVGAAAGVCLAFGLGSIDWRADKEEPEPEPKQVGDTTWHEPPADTVGIKEVKEMGLEIMPTVNVVGTPLFEDGGYTFTVKVRDAPPGGGYDVVVLDHLDHSRVVARSADGHFAKVPASTVDGGVYDFALCATGNSTLLCDPVERAGFISQQTVHQRLSKEQLQELIDRYDDSLGGAGGNPYIAPDCKIEFQGLPDGSANAPTNLWDVADKVDMGIWKVNVEKLEYDKMNRIKVV